MVDMVAKYLFHESHPLANVYIDVENHHFEWLNQRKTINGHLRQPLVITRGYPNWLVIKNHPLGWSSRTDPRSSPC